MPEIIVNKVEKVEVEKRTVSKIVSLEDVLLDLYRQWKEESFNREMAAGNKEFLHLRFAFDFLCKLVGNIPDLYEVDFTPENMEFGDVTDGFAEEAKSFLGFHTLDNGVLFLGIEAGGDWEYPVCMILYHDGENIRGYIPRNGNTYDTDSNTAFGSEMVSLFEYRYASDVDALVDWAHKRGYIDKDKISPEDYGSYYLKADYPTMLEEIRTHITI